MSLDHVLTQVFMARGAFVLFFTALALFVFSMGFQIGFDIGSRKK